MREGKEMNAIELKPVPFHGDTIFLVEKGGEPYTPVRRICENLGISWSSQSMKLRKNPARWGYVVIDIPSNGGIQEFGCIPLRKCNGWLQSISPRKVKPEIRPSLEMYQNESDTVLWKYWTEGFAVNPRAGFEIEPAVGMKSVPMEKWAAIQEERANLLAFKLRTYEEGWKPRRKRSEASTKVTNAVAAQLYDLEADGRTRQEMVAITGVSETRLSYFFRDRPILPFSNN
jgi:hypothetical protein